MSFAGPNVPLESCDDPENEEPWLRQLIRRAREDGEVYDKTTNIDLLLQDEYPNQGKRRRATKWFDDTGISPALEIKDPYNHPWSTLDTCWYYKEQLQSSNGVQSTLKFSKTLQSQHDTSIQTTSSTTREPGSESTRIYATDPSAEILALILWDAKKREAEPFSKFIQTYIRGQDSGSSIDIAIDIENGGITDSWSFNLPSLRLTTTEGDHPLDGRKLGEGDERWRKSEDMSFFEKDRDTDGDLKGKDVFASHEVNQSVLVLRHSKNESNWTALCLRDTFPYGPYDEDKNDNAELLEQYTEKQEQQSNKAWDPIMFGAKAVDDVREADLYFFFVLQSHLNLYQDVAEEQYEHLKRIIKDRHEKITKSDLSEDTEKFTIRELFQRNERDKKWALRSKELVTKLREYWCQTIQAWEDVQPVIEKLDNSRVIRSIHSIDRHMRDLRKNVKQLEALMEILVRISEALKDYHNSLNNHAIAEQVTNGRVAQFYFPMAMTAQIIQANIITVGSSWMQFCVMVAFMCLFNRGFNFEDPRAILHQLYTLIQIVLALIHRLVPDRWSQTAGTIMRRLPWMRPRSAIPDSPQRNAEHGQISVGHIETDCEEAAFGTLMNMDMGVRRPLSRPKPARLPSDTTLRRHETEATLVERPFTTGPLPTSRQHTNTNTAEANINEDL